MPTRSAASHGLASRTPFATTNRSAMNVEPRKRVLVFGHGSDEPGNKLNSAASFVAVRQSGADGVELDVRRTADDQLIAIHDHTLPDGTPVAAAHSSQLPPEVPALAEVL